MTTKIIALVDALGCLVRFVLLPGQRHDMMGVQPLIDDVHFDALIADKTGAFFSAVSVGAIGCSTVPNGL